MTLSPLFSFIVPCPLLERTQEGVGEGQVLHYHIRRARDLRYLFPRSEGRGSIEARLHCGECQWGVYRSHDGSESRLNEMCRDHTSWVTVTTGASTMTTPCDGSVSPASIMSSI